jgi:hypothetical protein
MAGVIGAALVAVAVVIPGPTNPAAATPVPKPAGEGLTIDRPHRPVAQPGTQSATVWVQAEDGLGLYAGIYATGFWNPRTGLTDFTGQLTPDGFGWANVPCPSGAGGLFRPACLRVVWGTLPQGVHATYQPMFCAEGCLRQGLITVNRFGPYFCNSNPECPYPPIFGDWNPWNVGTMVTHFFGRFIGLAEIAGLPKVCTSVMGHNSWHCAPPGPGDDWLTDAEATHVAAW